MVGFVVGLQALEVGLVVGSQVSEVGLVVGLRVSEVGSVVGSRVSVVGSVEGSRVSVVGLQGVEVCSREVVMTQAAAKKAWPALQHNQPEHWSLLRNVLTPETSCHLQEGQAIKETQF